MTIRHGDFIWYELLTKDADAAADFYAAVMGWTGTPSGQPDMDYRLFWSADPGDPANGVGGYMAITPDMAAHGAQPCWVGYIAVDDVDASSAVASAAGGAILMPAMDIAGVGRLAMLADPVGVPFYIMRGASDEASHSFAKYAPRLGHAAWNELATSDQSGAWDFYGKLFGWAHEGSLDMGPLGDYQFFKTDVVIGAIMPKTPDMPTSVWTSYFRVADIDAAMMAVKANGGTCLMDATEIPGGDYSMIAMDPHGATFGLVGARMGAS